MFKVIKKIYIQRCLVLLLLTLNIFRTLLNCYCCRIRANKCQLGLRNYSFRNKFVFSNCDIVSYRAGQFCWATCFHSHSPNTRLWKDKWINFHETVLPKDKSNPVQKFQSVLFFVLLLTPLSLICTEHKADYCD